MRERPILFSAPMILRLLDGSKTQTRRLIAPQQPKASTMSHYELEMTERDGSITAFTKEQFVVSRHNRHGARGDRLWVRETHAQFAVGNRTGVSPQCVAYRATCADDGGFDYVNNGDEIMHLKVTKWTPSIFMPRWASRITLEITEVRVQRLQEISEDDARAEGCESAVTTRKVYPSARAANVEIRSYCDGFATLWDSINGKRSAWASNPWVWAITFRRVP